MKRILCIFLVIFFGAGFLVAGEKPKTAKTLMLSGKVSDLKSNELLAGVKISCEACHKVVYSDLDGRFFIYLQVEAGQNAEIEFSQVGYAAKTLKIQDIGPSASPLEVILEEE